MRRLLLALLVPLVLVGGTAVLPVLTGGAATVDPPTLSQQLAKAKAANRLLRDQRDEARDQRDTLRDLVQDRDAQLAARDATIDRLRARDPVDQVLALDPAAQWTAIVAIWRVFPTLDIGSRCGYSKSQDGLDDSYASFSFYRWTLC